MTCGSPQLNAPPTRNASALPWIGSSAASSRLAAAIDIKTLAAEAGVDRTAFYGNRSYAHLRADFERRLRTLQQAGEQPDPRDAQITRLTNEITTLKHRLAGSTSTIEELADFKASALARLAAQHDEITRLRATLGTAQPVRHLHARNRTSGPCS
jgi:CII-binding regulator of phage lambda lysogenization HflD